MNNCGEKRDQNYTNDLALSFAKLSALAYLKFEEDTAELKKNLQEIGFELVQTFNGKEFGTQAFVAKNINYAVCVFRGTEQNLTDILTDLKFRLNITSNGGVHRGFFAALTEVEEDIVKCLTDLGDVPLYITGHSLGGALAKALVLKTTIKFVAGYTYGSPSICEKKYFENNKIPVYRFINSADVVPRSLGIIGLIIAFFIWLVLWLSEKVCGLVKIKQSRVTAKKLIIEVLAFDMSKYTHFGTPVYFEEAGLIVDDKDAPSLMWDIVKVDWKRVFVDHKIANYIGVLELQQLLAKETYSDELRAKD